MNLRVFSQWSLRLVLAAVVASAGLLLVSPAPASAHSYCTKMWDIDNYRPPSSGYGCAYENKVWNSREKQRFFRLYKNGSKRSTVLVYSSSWGRTSMNVCDSRSDGIGAYGRYQRGDSYVTLHPSGAGRCARGVTYSAIRYRAWLYRGDRFGTVWYKWPIGSF